MSHPKRHHFVPQFYLRRFSADGHSLCCFHKKTEKFIRTAPIKGQCAIDNYYSWHEGVEPALGIIEGQVAEVIRKIAADERLPPRESPYWQDFLMFVALQAGRTRVSGDSSDAMMDYFAKLMAQGRPEFADIDLSKLKVRNTYPAALPMEVSIEGYSYLNSLGSALLINTSKTPFICSDNPVIFYNSQRAHVQDMGVIGLDSIGLQLFFALDERLAVYLYDKNVYSRPTNTGIRIPRAEDVLKINLIHYMWSDEVVYCNNPSSEWLIRSLCAASEDYIPYERIVFRESERVPGSDGRESSLLHNFRAQVPVEADFSFAKHEKRIPGLDSGSRSRPLNVANDRRPGGKRFEFVVHDHPRPHLGGSDLKRTLKAIERRAA